MNLVIKLSNDILIKGICPNQVTWWSSKV